MLFRSGYAFTVQKYHAAAVLRANLLAKGADADADALTITAASVVSAHGGTIALGAGEVTYTPASGFTGADTFTITIADGLGGSVLANVSATVANQAANAAQQSTLARLAGGSLEALFYGPPGALCEIQRTINLTDANALTTVATLPVGDDRVLVFTDPAPPAARAFYRTRTTTP